MVVEKTTLVHYTAKTLEQGRLTRAIFTEGKRKPRSPPGFNFEHAYFVIVFSKEIDFHALQLISSPIKNINNTRRFVYLHLKELKRQN